MSDELISHEELLLGFPAKRTTTLLFLIEKQATQLAARSLFEFSLSDSSYRHQELAFLKAFTIPNAVSLRPTIQDLERFANHWSVLVPENPVLKASLFKALSEKYDFTRELIPNILNVLDYENPKVTQAYQNLYKKPLRMGFVTKITIAQRLSWTITAIAKWIDSLSPFWTASLITISLGLPQAFLALPIAVAQLGSLMTVALLLVLGGINILTMVCMAEAITRNGDFHYGKTFIKQLTKNYLGKTGSLVLSLAVGIRVFLIALACYIGLSTAIANFTSLPASLCAVLLFILGLYILSRNSLKLTVTVTMLLAVLNISLLLFFSLLCFGNWQLDNILYFNWAIIDRLDFNAQIFDRVLGVLLMLYFGHVYVAECAKIVLPKDPSGTALIWGSITGTAFLTFIFCFWVIAVNGAIAPWELATQTGTVLEPLMQRNGMLVKILGTILVICLLGMAWLRSSSLLTNLVRECISKGIESTLTLSRQQGRLIFQTNDRYNLCSIGITYLGLVNKQSRFILDIQLEGKAHQKEIEVAQYWQVKQLFHQFPNLRRYAVDLNIEIQSANQEYVCIKVISTMNLAYEGNVQKNDNHQLAMSKKKNIDMGIIQAAWIYLLEQRHFFIFISPLLIVFLLTEALFLSEQESFTGILGFAGILGNSVVGGIFPILLLFSSRKKGEILPGKVLQLLNYPWLLISIYGFFLCNIILHGLFIWENPIAKVSALGVTIVSLGATLVMWVNGAFIPRTLIEFEEYPPHQGRGLFKISTGGKAKTAKVKLVYTQGEENYQETSEIEIPSISFLRYAIFQLPKKQSQELMVWTHSKNLIDDNEILPTLLVVNQKMHFDLKLFGGKILLPLLNDKCSLKLEFASRI